MKDQNNIQDELRSLNSGLPVNNSPTPFSVPEGYFNGLADAVLAKVKGQTLSAADELQELSPLLAGLSKRLPYTMPENYLAENLSVLPSWLKEEVSPVLAGLDKSLPYTVPQGYFKNFPEQMLAKLEQPKAKVVSLFARRWLRVAVAAVISGIALIGGYRFLNNDSGEIRTAYQQPADTTRNLVAKTDKTTVIQDIKSVSTKELDEFISAVRLNPAKMKKETTQPAGKTEVADLLKDVSAKEMDAFLEQIPTADEDLLVID